MKDRTIAAVSTPAGVGGICIIRLNGKDSFKIALRVFTPFGKEANSLAKTEFVPEPNKMVLGTFQSEGFKEKCLMVYFKNPHSYTGDDLVEFHCHGGTVIAKGVLETLLKNGAVLAEPGEFTKQAFINGKLTLDEAEGVIDMINAESESEVRAGYKLLEGELSKQVKLLQESLTKTLAKIEVVLDYPENDYEEQTVAETIEELNNIDGKLSLLLATSATGQLIKQGSRVLILGKPNVGKSSVLNAMLGTNRAIVTNIKGTTRDMLEEVYSYKGMKFVLTDTAGLRESSDEVERIGIDRAKTAVNTADIVLFLIDGSEALAAEDKEILPLLKNKKVIVVVNKADLKQKAKIEDLFGLESGKETVLVSALNNTGIMELKEKIYNMVIDENIVNSGVVLTNMRHVNVLKEAKEITQQALHNLKKNEPLDVVTIDLNLLWQTLGEVTGNTDNESIIDEIFSSFCVGK